MLIMTTRIYLLKWLT